MFGIDNNEFIGYFTILFAVSFVILTILMPFYVYGIYQQSKKTNRLLKNLTNVLSTLTIDQSFNNSEEEKSPQYEIVKEINMGEDLVTLCNCGAEVSYNSRQSGQRKLCLECNFVIDLP